MDRRPVLKQPNKAPFVSFDDVMPGVDAEYRVSPAGLKEQLVLESSEAPRSFDFEVTDPAHLLGDVEQDIEGGFSFSKPVGDGLKLSLAAPRAWEQKKGQTSEDTGVTSAHQTVQRTRRGYLVSLSLDPEWLEGKSFPIVLDPTLEYSYEDETISGAWAPEGPDACEGLPCPLASSGNQTKVGSPSWDETNEYAAYYHLDLSSIPASTPIAAASFALSYKQGPDENFPGTSTLDLDTLDQLLEPGDSWSDLDPGGYAGIQSTFGPPVGEPNDLDGELIVDWHRADVTKSVRHWLDTSNGASAGFKTTLSPDGWAQLWDSKLVIDYTGRALPPPIPVEQTWGCSCAFSHGPDRVELDADPVNTADGGLMESHVDLTVQAPGIPMRLRRTYNGSDTTEGTLGIGWTQPFETSLSEDAITGDVTFRDPTGGRVGFIKQTDGSYLGDVGVTGHLEAVTGGWELTSLTNQSLTFNDHGKLTGDVDAAGNGVSVSYTGSGASATVETLTDAAGHEIAFTYGTAGAATGKIVSVVADDGRAVLYGYTTVAGGPHLTAVTAPDGKVTTLSYASGTGKLDGITGPGSHTSAQNVYDPSTGRITEQTDARGNTWLFDWAPSTDAGAPQGTGVQTTTDPLDHTTENHYYGNVITRHVDEDDETTDYYYDDALNQVAVKDPRGYVTSMTYDAAGNLLTLHAPHPMEVEESWTYDGQNNVESHTDGAGDTTLFSYNGTNELISSTNALEETTSYTYTTTGLLHTVATPEGRTTTYDYDADGYLISETSPSGRVTSYGRDDVGRMTSVTDPRGNLAGATAEAFTTHYTYDAAGRTLTTTDPKDTVTFNTYDDDGNLATRKVTNPATTPAMILTDTSYAYDPDGHLLTSTEYEGTPDERTTFTNTYDEFGSVTSSTDATGAKTSFSYNALGLLDTKTTPRGNEPGATSAEYTWRFAYDENGSQVSTTDPASNITQSRYDALNQRIMERNPNGSETHYEYDGAGRQAKVTIGRQPQTEWRYDPAGRVSEVLAPGTDTWTTYTYDQDGNKLYELSPSGMSLTEWTFSPDGQIDTKVTPNAGDPADYTSTYTYDAAGNQTSETDELGYVTSWTYDAVNNQTSKTSPNSSQTVNWTYDRLGRLTEVAPPGTAGSGGHTIYTYNKYGDLVTREDGEHHTTTYEYDSRNQVTSISDPLSRQRTFDYDAEGNLTAWVTPRGHASGATASDWTVNQTYDARGLLTARTTSETGVNTGSSTTMSYDPAGQLVEVVDADETTGLSYTAAGQLYGVTRNHQWTYEYGHDSRGRLTSVSGPAGATTTYGYDSDGRQTSMTDGDGQTTTFDYNANRQLSTINHPSSVGLVETRNYDAAGRLSSIRNKKNGAANALSKFIYTRDANGNVLRVQTTRGTTVTNEAFTYSLKNWLTKHCPGTTTCTGANNYVSYGYSATGNRLTEQRAGTVANPGTTTNTYNNADELTTKVLTNPGGSTTTNYDYTADGQLSSDGRTWNVLGQLTAANVNGAATYTYDGIGNRRTVTTSAGTTRQSWDLNNPMPMLAVTTDPNDDSSIHRYTPTGEILATEHPAAAYDRSYYGHDAMGSVTDVLQGSGTPAWKYTYEPFGSTTSANALTIGAVDTNFGYTSGYQEGTLGAEYALRARDYDPATGRFSSVDPLAPIKTDPYGSAYAYVNNQPTLFVDPTGEYKCMPYVPDPCDVVEPAKSAARNIAGAVKEAAEDPQQAKKNLGAGAVDGVSDTGIFLVQQGSHGRISESQAQYAESKVDDMWREAGVDPDSCNFKLGPYVAMAIPGAGVAGSFRFLTRFTRLGRNFFTKTADELPGLLSTAPKPLRLGSTGRTVPSNIREQMAMTSVRNTPAGQPITRIRMSDPRWPAGDGWVKMQQMEGDVNIHYVYNTVTGAYDDFKFATPR